MKDPVHDEDYLDGLSVNLDDSQYENSEFNDQATYVSCSRVDNMYTGDLRTSEKI
jgi:hypothetical protein